VKQVFADSSFWIATLHPADELFAKALRAAEVLGKVELVTSELVVVEVLNHFCALGPNLRSRAARWASDVGQSFGFRVFPYDARLAEESLQLYSARPDKQWSFVDCMSFVIMQSQGITEALSADHHFAQAGFINLLA
jgi:predicted nucleic acid-binding protein